MKPGGASSADPMPSGSSSAAASPSAIRIGAMRATGASCMAALVA